MITRFDGATKVADVTAEKYTPSAPQVYANDNGDDVQLGLDWRSTENQLTLPAGTYIVTAASSFSKISGSITNTFYIRINKGDFRPATTAQMSVEGGFPSASVTGILKLTSQKTIYLDARFGDGSGGFTAKATGPRFMQAVRIGDA